MKIKMTGKNIEVVIGLIFGAIGIMLSLFALFHAYGCC